MIKTIARLQELVRMLDNAGEEKETHELRWNSYDDEWDLRVYDKDKRDGTYKSITTAKTIMDMTNSIKLLIIDALKPTDVKTQTTTQEKA